MEVERHVPVMRASLRRAIVLTPRIAVLGLCVTAPAAIDAQRGGGTSPTARAASPIDLTGYWVSVVTEDWRYRMVTPAKGDFASVPLNDEGRKVVDAWDPAKDTASGNECKAYGAANIMRVPGRVHVTWQDDNTLKIETDAGQQTRLLRFGEPQPPAGEAGWQGYSAAAWEMAGGPPRGGGGGGRGVITTRGVAPGGDDAAAGDPDPGGGRGGAGRGGAARGGPPAPPQGGSLKVVTTHLKAGYLRKNGVPYSEGTTLTEYYDRHNEPNGDQWFTVTTIVDDPKYLQQPFITSTHFKKEPDGAKWRPTPCTAS
jgi:hypothetical protein